MKTNLLKIILAVVAGFFVLGATLYGQAGSRGSDSRIGSIGRERAEAGAIEAKAITKEEAAKKYPVKGGATLSPSEILLIRRELLRVRIPRMKSTIARRLITEDWSSTHA